MARVNIDPRYPGGPVLLPCERCGEATVQRICQDCRQAETAAKPKKRAT